MDDSGRSQVELMIKYGDRRKPYYDMCRTTGRQKFIEHMKIWLRDELPLNFTVFFYDKKWAKMMQLNDNEICYLAPIFDSISFERQAVGVQSLSVNDHPCIKLYISSNDLSNSPRISLEEFAGGFQLCLANIATENINSAVVNDSVSSESASWPTDIDLLLKDLLSPNVNTEKDSESFIVVHHISPTINIQLRLIDHLRMVHDVCPIPIRRNYVSNMGKKGKSNLAYLSGIKGPNDRGKQIRPIIFIPDTVLEWLRENGSLELVVACVRETLENGVRAWWIDEHSEFRTKGCTRKTPGVNPLELPLTLKAIKNRNFTLQLILTHIPGRINTDRNGDHFHSLDDALVNQLHGASHDPTSSRLALVIASHGIRQFNTIGFSNFIQEPKCKKATSFVQNQAYAELPTTQAEPQMAPIMTSEVEHSIENVNATL